MVDRTQVPITSPITSVPLIEPETLRFSNGVPVYFLNTGTQDVMKIDLWFNTGAVHGATPNLTASMVDLLREGTTDLSAKQIAEKLDGFGAHLETNTYKEQSSISLYCLSKFGSVLIPTIAALVKDPSFPEGEVSTYRSKKSQRLKTDLEKVSTLAGRAFSANLFGSEHTYSRITMLEDWDVLNRPELLNHHKQRFLPSLCRIMVSGRIPSSTESELNEEFGTLNVQGAEAETRFPTERTKALIEVEKAGVVQNAIKIGRPLFNRLHADHIGMKILTTILGGYFGSRLMSNIREDKGYTYGISAGIQTLKNSGYFMLSTEVGSEVYKATINEVNHELMRLCEEPVNEEELSLVRNYIMGQQLKSVDGPFALANKWNGLLNAGLSASDHAAQIEEILSISSTRIADLANRYLRPEMMMTVVAGKI